MCLSNSDAHWVATQLTKSSQKNHSLSYVLFLGFSFQLSLWNQQILFTNEDAAVPEGKLHEPLRVYCVPQTVCTIAKYKKGGQGIVEHICY